MITGSYNWTASAGQRNNENLLIIRDEEVAQKYLEEFNRLWSEHSLFEGIKIQKEKQPTGPLELVATCFAGNPEGKDEWVVIQNTSGKTCNLDGWFIADDDGHKFVVKEVQLAPNQKLAIVNREAAEVTVPYDKLYCLDYDDYWWNNEGDLVRLLNSTGEVVMEVEVGDNS